MVSEREMASGQIVILVQAGSLPVGHPKESEPDRASRASLLASAVP